MYRLTGRQSPHAVVGTRSRANRVISCFLIAVPRHSFGLKYLDLYVHPRRQASIIVSSDLDTSYSSPAVAAKVVSSNLDMGVSSVPLFFSFFLVPCVLAWHMSTFSLVLLYTFRRKGRHHNTQHTHSAHFVGEKLKFTTLQWNAATKLVVYRVTVDTYSSRAVCAESGQTNVNNKNERDYIYSIKMTSQDEERHLQHT